MEYKIIENELVPIYEREDKEKLESKQEFANWIKNRISMFSKISFS